MGEVDPADRKLFLQDRNRKAVFLRNLHTRGVPEEAPIAFLDDFAREQELREQMYGILQGSPRDVELARRQEGLDLAAHWLRERRGGIYCLINDVGILAGEPVFFLEYFDLFSFLDGHQDALFASPSLDTGFVCVETHDEYYWHQW